MQDRVHPGPAAASKPPPQPMSVSAPPATTANGVPIKPPPRRRPAVYPRPPPRRSFNFRRCCCLCFLYTFITLLVLLLLVAIAAVAFYFLYHPKHPSFSVDTLRISTFNLTSSASSVYPHVASVLNLTMIAKNPNKKLIIFNYDPVTVSVSSEGADLGNSTVQGFASVPGNVIVLVAQVRSDPTKGQDPDSVSQLGADLNKKSGKGSFPVDVGLETEVMVKIGKLRSKSVGIKVSCTGIQGFAPTATAMKKKGTATTAAAADTAGGKCKVDLRLKIWKFTLF